MAIDSMGSRFYMQQGIGQRRKSGFNKKIPTRLKKDIVADIEAITKLKLTSLMNVTKQTLEDLYGAFRIHEG